MSLIGIRDMSVLEEAPQDRTPIQTYVMEYNDEMVREAISRELARGGQVYYVYNRVNSIVEITNQYMEYIKAMQKEDLNIMSEFLVMAATLLDIKCRMLLPKEVNEEGEEEDPRQELVEQLLQYKMHPANN